jgi:hypothetical protein
MKPLLRVSLKVLLAVSIYSCSSSKPISRLAPENNQSYKVDYLFEHDGCKVYRFYDHGHFVYFTNCSGEISSFDNDSTQIPVTNRIKNNPVH